jgi:hypothetical protein
VFKQSDPGDALVSMPSMLPKTTDHIRFTQLEASNGLAHTHLWPHLER